MLYYSTPAALRRVIETLSRSPFDRPMLRRLKEVQTELEAQMVTTRRLFANAMQLEWETRRPLTSMTTPASRVPVAVPGSVSALESLYPFDDGAVQPVIMRTSGQQDGQIADGEEEEDGAGAAGDVSEKASIEASETDAKMGKEKGKGESEELEDDVVVVDTVQQTTARSMAPLTLREEDGVVSVSALGISGDTDANCEAGNQNTCEAVAVDVEIGAESSSSTEHQQPSFMSEELPAIAMGTGDGKQEVALAIPRPLFRLGDEKNFRRYARRHCDMQRAMFFDGCTPMANSHRPLYRYVCALCTCYFSVAATNPSTGTADSHSRRDR